MTASDSYNSLNPSDGSVIRVISEPNAQEEAEKLARKNSCRVFRVDVEVIDSKESLLSAISEAFSFPPYFGGNWDALEECLCDQSWKEGEVVFLIFVTADRLLDLDLRDVSALTNVLSDTALFWRGEGVDFQVLLFGSSRLNELINS
ncbi:MAG: barstar family protein [Terriglobia bacterium]